jgi:hypothetical protein
MGPINAQILLDEVVDDRDLEFDAGHVRLGSQVLTLARREVGPDPWVAITNGDGPLSEDLFDQLHW